MLYAVCFILERIALTSLSGLLSFIVLAVTSIMTRFAPGIMTGAYLISSTSISEFIGAMERMHITEKIVIPMSVIFRFFPTISEEYQAIRDAMKMRGIRVPDRFPCSRFDCDSVLRYLFCLVFVSAADFFLTGGGEPMIRIDHVTFSYGEENENAGGVHDINLTVEDGQCVVLCGESGSGTHPECRISLHHSYT